MKLKKFLSILLCFLILSSMASTFYTVAYAETDHIHSMNIGGNEVKQLARNLRGRWSTDYRECPCLHYRANDDDDDNNANTKRIYYCLEPGAPLPADSNSSYINTGNYWTAYDKTPDSNPTISGETVRKLIGKVLTYGYDGFVNVGTGNLKWRDTNLSKLNGGDEARGRILKALATQVLIWEVVVGERDANFNHTPHAERNNAKTVFSFTNNNHKNTFNDYYSEIVEKIKDSLNPTKPSFANGGTTNITTMTNNGNYKIELTDNNGVLSDWELDYTNNNVTSATKSGNKLTITLSSGVGNGNEINFDLLRSFKRRKMAIWGDGISNNQLNFALQDVVTYVKDTGNNDAYVDDEIKVNFKLKVVKNKITVNKSSLDGKKEGFTFKLTGNNIPDLTETTNASGIAEFKGIPNGTYTVTEVLGANAHYVVPESKSIVVNGSGGSVSFINSNKFIRFQFTKTDSSIFGGAPQGDASFYGAQYGLYRNGNLIATYTLDNAGKIIANTVYGENNTTNDYGYTAYYYATDTNGNIYNYTVKELSSPVGYLLNSETIKLTNSVTGSSTQFTTASNVNLPETVVKGKFKLFKYSSGNGSTITPEGGVTFKVYLTSAGSYDNAPANAKTLITTDSDGYAVTGDLPYGEYTFEQVNNVAGTKKASNVTDKITTNGAEVPVSINNLLVNRQVELRIKKIDSENKKPITKSSACFNIYASENDAKNNRNPVFTNVLTGANGVATVQLGLDKTKAITYYIKEVSAPNGYKLSDEIKSVTIDGSSMKDGQLNVVECGSFTNTLKTGDFYFSKYGEVFKSDGSMDIAPISDAEFGVYVRETIYDGTGSIYEKNGIKYTANTLIKTVKSSSNENGKVIIKFLPEGKYYFKEIGVPVGYLKDNGTYNFEIKVSDNENTSLTPSNIEIINRLKTYKISVNKKLEIDSKYGIGNNDEYKNVEFGLYALSDAYFGVSLNISQAPTWVYRKDQLIATTTLNSNGVAQFNVKLPFNGTVQASQKYYIKEIATDSKYILCNETREFTIDENTNSDIEINFPENKIARGTISGIKVEKFTDSDNVEREVPLANAKIGLYLGDLTLNGIGTANPIVTYTTGADGKYSFENVPYGTYTVHETTPPTYIDAEGNLKEYARAKHQEKGVCVNISNDGELVSGDFLKLENSKEKGYIKINIYKTAETDNLEGFAFNIKNVENGIKESINEIITIKNSDIKNINGVLTAVLVFEKLLDDEVENVITISEVLNEKAMAFKELEEVVLTEDDFSISANDYTVKEANVFFHNEYLRKDVVVKKELDKLSTDTLDGFAFNLKGTTAAGDKFEIEGVTTNENGIATFENVPYGVYEVSEVANEKAKDYIIPAPQAINLKGTGNDALVFTNTYPTGSLKIRKTSEDGRVENVAFLVENYSVGFSNTYRTDEFGNITINNLREGNYAVSEVFDYQNEDDNPYVTLDTQSFNVIRGENNPEPLVFNNIIKKGRVRILKTSERNDVEGFQFNITGTALNGDLYNETFITDENGYICNAEDNYIKLKVGTYTVRELVNPNKTEGYIIPEPIEFKITKNNEVLEPITLLNKVKYGSLTINKTSTNGVVEGFKFKVSGKTIFDEDYIDYIETDANGNAVFNNIPLGNYTVEEVNNEKTVGYVIEKPKSFSITSDNLHTDFLFENVFKEGTLEIVKTSEDNKITGISFIVNGTTIEGKNYNDTFVTDKDGRISKVLPEGQYTVTEVRDEKTNHYIELQPFVANIQHDKTTTVNVENTLKKSLLTIYKTSDNDLVENFEFTITGTTLGGDEYSTKVTTNKNGIVSVTVPYGSYTIKETDKLGYLPQDKIYQYVNSEYTNIVVHNKVKLGTLVVNKTSTNNVVADFDFKLTGTTVFGDNVEISKSSNKNGLVLFENLMLGDYTIEEVDNQKTIGYVIENAKDFSVTEHNQIVSVGFNNVFKEGTLIINKTAEDNKIEGISFEIKGTTIEGKDYEKTVTTNKTGIVEIVVPEGQYAVTEVRDEKTNHYIELDSKSISINHGLTHTIDFNNVLKKSLLTIVKTSDNNLVEGFEFTISGITLGGDEYSVNKTTNENGLISFKIPYGEYEITEKNVTGYIENASIKNIVIDTDEISIPVHNKLKLGALTVSKTSTNGVVEGFDFKLTGKSVFGDNIEVIESTDENGNVVFDNLMLGDYVIEEINNDKVIGYVTENPKEFSVTDNNLSITKSFNNIFKEGTIKIIKTSEDNKIENISFVINGTTIEGKDYEKTIKTNFDGIATIVVPEGEYTITEVIDEVTKQYTKLDSQNIKVKHEKVSEIKFHNVLKKSTFTLTKTSDNNLIEGFEFEIKGTTLGGDDYSTTKVTDSNGKITFVIPYGTYTVTEKDVNGYVSNNPLNITIDKPETNISVHNKVKLGKLLVTKTSTNNIVEGFDFKLTGTSVFGDKVEISKITDKNGNIIFDNLMLGTYEIEEIDNDKTVGYIIETKKSFTITEDKQKVNVSFNNVFKQGTVNITKKSEDNRVENIKFLIKGTTVEETSYEREFYTGDKGLISVILPEGEYTVEEVIDNNTSHYIPLDSQSIKVVHDSTTNLLFENILKKSNIKIIKTSSDDKVKDIDFTIKGTTLGGDEVEFVKTTDENGLIEFTTPYGDYVITEEELDGYVYKEPIEITVNEDETVVNVHNEVKMGKLKIKKTSTDGKVKGFSFTVKGKTETGDKYNKTFKTNKDGIIVINLPTGTYKVSEIKNDKTKNYIIPKPQEVNVFEDETTIIKFKNVRKEEKVHEKPSSPKTGDMNGNLAIFTFFISIAGCWLSLRGLKKNSK